MLYNINNDDKIDKLNQNTKIEGVNQQELVYPDFPGVTTLVEMSEFDKLLMCLFTKLGKFIFNDKIMIENIIFVFLQENYVLILDLPLENLLDKLYSQQFLLMQIYYHH